MRSILVLSAILDGWPISVNDAYVPFKTKKFISTRLSKVGEAYKLYASTQIASAAALTLSAGPDKSYNLYILLTAPDIYTKGWPKTAKNRHKKVDVSNHIKLLEDALFSCLPIDDSQVMQMTIEKKEGPEKKTYLFLYEVADE